MLEKQTLYFNISKYVCFVEIGTDHPVYAVSRWDVFISWQKYSILPRNSSFIIQKDTLFINSTMTRVSKTNIKDIHLKGNEELIIRARLKFFFVIEVPSDIQVSVLPACARQYELRSEKTGHNACA